MITNKNTQNEKHYLCEEIESYLNELKKQDAKKTTKELEQELIEYILAQIAALSDRDCVSKNTKEIGDEIDRTIKTFTTDIRKCDALASQVHQIDINTNSQSANTISALTALLAMLQNDLKSGDMSNLPDSVF